MLKNSYKLQASCELWQLKTLTDKRIKCHFHVVQYNRNMSLVHFKSKRPYNRSLCVCVYVFSYQSGCTGTQIEGPARESSTLNSHRGQSAVPQRKCCWVFIPKWDEYEQVKASGPYCLIQAYEGQAGWAVR